MSDAKSSEQDLRLLIRSRHPLVFLETSEEARTEDLVAGIAASEDIDAYVWTITGGLRRIGENAHEETRDPKVALAYLIGEAPRAVVVAHGLEQFLDDPHVSRLLADLVRAGQPTLLVRGSGLEIPESLQGRCVLYHLPKPDATAIRRHIDETLGLLGERGRFKVALSSDELDRLAASLRGLTLAEVDHAIMEMGTDDSWLDSADVDGATEIRRKLLASNSVIELEPAELGFEWVAGFEHVKQWVNQRTAGFTAEGQKLGLEPPKGFILTGVPGCGKSLAVKALAHDWRMPLLRLDAGRLYDRFVGSSEANLREALDTAEALAPSILWIDEIEKGFASSGPSQTDGGLGFRLLGTLATWMQERPAPVFVAATSNDVTVLPAELTRQGRFDEMFFVDLPSGPEREHLVRLQLARRGLDWESIPSAGFAQRSEGFSGAEIEQVIVNALYAAHAAGAQVSETHLLDELARTRPLSVTAAPKIAAIRAWGAEHARPASGAPGGASLSA